MHAHPNIFAQHRQIFTKIDFIAQFVHRSVPEPPPLPRSSNAGRPGSTPDLALAPQQPFGGFKWSGIGVENGPWGLAEFSEFQVVHRSKAPNGLNANTASLLS